MVPVFKLYLVIILTLVSLVLFLIIPICCIGNILHYNFVKSGVLSCLSIYIRIEIFDKFTDFISNSTVLGKDQLFIV